MCHAISRTDACSTGPESDVQYSRQDIYRKDTEYRNDRTWRYRSVLSGHYHNYSVYKFIWYGWSTVVCNGQRKR